MQYNAMAIKYLSFTVFIYFNCFLVGGEASSAPACRTFPVGISGTCVPMQDCPRLNNLLQITRRSGGKISHAYTLRNSICTVKPTTVCCEPPLPRESQPSSDPTDGSYDLPTGCGKGTLQNFIVGGEDSGWWPWIVLLITNDIPFCGGTLIHESFVLTAAHCITTDFVLETVRVGELNLGSNPDTWKDKTAPPVQVVPVAEIIKHPHHDLGCNRCNDLALIRLEHPVQINEFVSAICLPLKGFSLSDIEGNEATAAGWGVSNLHDNSRPLQPDHLQQVHLAINTAATYCQKKIVDYPDGSIICAGSGDGKDTCKGDSGGPLMLDDPNGLRSYLVGVTSHGPAYCGVEDTQGIYMSVAYYLPWILETMRNSSSSAKNTSGVSSRRSSRIVSNPLSPSRPKRRRLIFN